LIASCGVCVDETDCVKEAKERGLPIISEEWVDASIARGKREAEDDYSVSCGEKKRKLRVKPKEEDEEKEGSSCVPTLHLLLLAYHLHFAFSLVTNSYG